MRGLSAGCYLQMNGYRTRISRGHASVASALLESQGLQHRRLHALARGHGPR